MDEEAGHTTQIHSLVVTGVVTCGFTHTHTHTHARTSTHSETHPHNMLRLFNLRVEFLLKTESGYLRDAEVT